MANRKPLIDKDEEAQKITAGDTALFKPFSTLPKAAQKVLLSLRRAVTKSSAQAGNRIVERARS
jgi:hypothetical protein